MKKSLLTLIVVLTHGLVFAQGIEFKQGSWAEALTEAKASDKMVFVDVYTTWCGPCKAMDKNVFPLKEVGDVYNNDFVCYKVDAEKGEGISIAKKYNVKAYPTYLFVKPDAALVMASVGGMTSNDFLKLAASAHNQANDFKPLSEWEEEYARKQDDATFLLEYINKRYSQGKSSIELMDQYLFLVSSEERVSEAVVEMYNKEKRNITIWSQAYSNLRENYKLFGPRLSAGAVMSMAVDNSLKRAIAESSDTLFLQVLEANETIPDGTGRVLKEKLCLGYYKSVGPFDKYSEYATEYCENRVMRVTMDSIARLEKKSLQSFDDQRWRFEMVMDSAQIASLRENVANAARQDLSADLNNIAWEFFLHATEPEELQKALVWSKRATEIAPANIEAMDTYANLLYKIGDRKKAVKLEKKLLSQIDPNDVNIKSYEEVLRKMKAGEETW